MLVPQVSSFVATLGFEPKCLWDFQLAVRDWPVSTTATALSHYNDLMAQIKQAASDQAAPQKQLAAALSESRASL